MIRYAITDGKVFLETIPMTDGCLQESSKLTVACIFDTKQDAEKMRSVQEDKVYKVFEVVEVEVRFSYTHHNC